MVDLLRAPAYFFFLGGGRYGGEDFDFLMS